VFGKGRKGWTAGYRVGETPYFNPGARSLIPIYNRVAVNISDFSSLHILICVSVTKKGGGGRGEGGWGEGGGDIHE
jgi:hypothetical protein